VRIIGYELLKQVRRSIEKIKDDEMKAIVAAYIFPDEAYEMYMDTDPLSNMFCDRINDSKGRS